MPESILKYAAGVPGKAAVSTDMTGAGNAASAISRLAAAVGETIHQSELADIRESQKAAEADILQNTIDPDRQQNDEAYAGVVLRNNLFKETKGLMEELENPGSELSRMEPEKFSEMLQQKSNDFYKQAGKTPFASSQADIYSQFTLKMQPAAIALQAKNYKDMRKAEQGRAAIEALTDLPKGTPEAFSENTAAMIDQMLPPDRYTEEERMKAIMSSARASVTQGDRRLLDWAKENMDLDIFMARDFALAEGEYLEWSRAKEDATYQTAFLENEKKAMIGGYTQEQWEQDMQDGEKVRRWGQQTMTRWFKASHKEQVSALTIDKFTRRFSSGLPMTGAPDDMIQSVYQNSFRDAVESVQGKPPEAKLEAMSAFAGLLANQGVVYKELKQNMDAVLGRPIFTIEAWENEDFQDSLMMFKSLQQVMKPEQLKQQVGEEAYTQALLAEDAMKMASGDPEKAGAIYMASQEAAAKRPDMGWKNRPDTRAMAEDMEDIISGNAEGADPAFNGWFGRQIRGGDSIMRTQLEYEYSNAYGRYRAAGLSDESARKAAKDVVAAGTKVFGNEVVWTGGVPMNALIGMDPSASPTDRDKAWELICSDLDLDPTEVRFKMVGNYAMIVDQQGVPVHGKAIIPRELIGQRYQAVQADEAERQKTTNAVTLAQDIAKRNREFELELNSQYGDGNDTAHFLPGMKLGDYRYANEDERTRMRSMYREENRGLIGSVIKHIYDEIQATREDPSSDKYREQWKTKSWAVDGNGNVNMALEGDKLRQAAESTAVKKGPEVGGDMPEAESTLKGHEGFKGKPYKDTVGVKTVGYGRNLEANPITPAEWNALGGKRDLTKEPLTKQEADVLFQNDMKRATDAVGKLYGNVELTPARQEALTNMAFNLGAGGMRKFKKMNKAIEAGDWDAAAREMLYNSPKVKTKWHRQVGKRARELAAMVRKG